MTIKTEQVKAHPSIIIKADGSVYPPGSPISTTDNVTYTFTADINEPIGVERDNIIINGANHTLYGGGTFSYGIYLEGRTNVTITSVQVKAFYSGIYLWNSSDSKVYGNNMTANKDYAIELIYSSNNRIFQNNLTANRHAVNFFASSNDNTMYQNSIANHHDDVAVYISNSFNITLYENTMNDNNYDLEVFGLTLEHFMHSIDVSNLIDGKPVYYLINQTDLTINPTTHPQIGYLALVNCFNATVTNLTLTSNGHGLLLAYTNNSRITDNNMINNYDGILLHASSGNTLSRNNVEFSHYYGIYLDGNSSDNLIFRSNVTNNKYGIELDVVSNNIVRGNNINGNEYGIYLWKSSNSSVHENTFVNNEYGVWIESELSFPNNRFYHNNFVDNYQHANIYVTGSYISGHNFWDDGFEGNYWSNYTGFDLDHDGIGDTEHVIGANNTDNYPLMGMFDSFDTSLGYNVNVISNSSVEDFHYFESNNTIVMHMSSMTSNQTYGFCRLAISHELIAPPYNITVNYNPIEHEIIFENETLSIIYFSYEHSTLEIIIIPESSSPIMLLVISILTTIPLAFANKKHRRKAKNAN
ncbi:right-handed parallel beta-helix repeat-containing protein [Candidatus Bathyarchaeota archaeon]|nr:right-handed parallel beta-helix repeat-containing protein [Candidatus Bathyarchaeota archaeon]